MKKIIIIISVFYISFIYAGAPAPKNLNSLPKAPHTFTNVTNINIGVEWNDVFVSQLLQYRKEYKIIKPLKGGISVFKSKNHKLFSNLSGSYVWVDVVDVVSNKKARLVLYGIYGPDNLITDVMKLVYNLNVYNGSSKFILINNKASVRTNVNKKNVLNIVLETSNNCINASGDFEILSNNLNSIINKSTIFWSSKKVCKAIPKSVLFNGALKDYKINKLLWAETVEDQKFTIDNRRTK